MEASREETDSVEHLTLKGAFPGLPDLESEDFERGSELARRDAGEDVDEVRRT